MKATKTSSEPKAPSRPAAAPAPIPTTESLEALQNTLSDAQARLAALQAGLLAARTEARAPAPAPADARFGPEFFNRICTQDMDQGAAAIAEDGEILYCNEKFARMVGRSVDSVQHTPFASFLPAEVWSQVVRVLHDDAGTLRYETTLRRDTDTGLPVMLAASRIAADDQAAICVLVTDLTSRKELEELRRARDAAEKTAAARDRFLAALSHELRTPITPALMAANVLEKDTGLPESARSDVSLIRRNIELEARLIDDLLDLTRITRGGLSLQREEMNLHIALNRAIEACQAEARQKRLTLNILLEARRTMIQGDPVRVQQACWNVLRNAVKFTPERGSISIRTGNDEHNQVWVEISDTGVGFAPDQAQRIFEAFEQVDSRGGGGRFGGLGLGLAISRSILHAHGGTLEAHSAGPNHGAKFTLAFQLMNGAGRHPAPALPRRKLNILLVEDHKDTRVCLQRLLEAASYRITSAGTAQAALDLAETTRFDLVISDLGLPDLGGHELMRRLHTRFGLPGIALSGYGMETDVEQSRAVGFTHHLTKPVSFDRLKSYVAEFAGKAQASPPPGPAS